MMRIDYQTIFPAATQAMAGLETAIHQSSLEGSLLEFDKAAGVPAERVWLLRGHAHEGCRGDWRGGPASSPCGRLERGAGLLIVGASRGSPGARP